MNEHTHYFFAAKIPDETKILMKQHSEKLKEILPSSVGSIIRTYILH
jgi:RNA 2',3'-cyclic 3'-phosphodiesterase